MLPILQIGPMAFPVPAFSLLLAFWLGLSLAEKFTVKHGVSANTLNNLVFTGVIAGLIAARFGYVLQFPNAFIQSPLSLFSPNPGLFDPFSAMAGALLGLLVYGQRARLGFWNTLDALTPLLAVMAVGLAIAHIASGEAFGAETSLPWGIELWGARRHPSQFYELIGAAIILLLLVRRAKAEIPAGILFLNFAALTAGMRLFLETFRGDSNLLLGGIRFAQIVAWLVLAVALYGQERIRSQFKKYEESQNG